MKITYKGDYALKSVLELAIHYGQDLVTIHDIAKHIDAPIKFLEQVLLDLKKGGFAQSRRGKIGGYLLSRPPSQITPGEVIRFINGPIEPISCINKKYSNCVDLNRCVFKEMWHKVSKATSDIIDNVTFEELALQANSTKQVLAYSI